MKMWHMSEADFDQFTENHKQVIKDMITTYLFEFEKA